MLEKITKILMELGFSQDKLGFSYIRDAIMLTYEDASNYTLGITKKLYPMVAEKNNTTPSRVGRAIRHSIECAYARAEADAIEKYFGPYYSAKIKIPTNKEVIASLTDYLKIYV